MMIIFLQFLFHDFDKAIITALQDSTQAQQAQGMTKAPINEQLYIDVSLNRTWIFSQGGSNKLVRVGKEVWANGTYTETSK